MTNSIHSSDCRCAACIDGENRLVLPALGARAPDSTAPSSLTEPAAPSAPTAALAGLTALPDLLVERQRAELCDSVTIPGDEWRAFLDDFIVARQCLTGPAHLCCYSDCAEPVSEPGFCFRHEPEEPSAPDSAAPSSLSAERPVATHVYAPTYEKQIHRWCVSAEFATFEEATAAEDWLMGITPPAQAPAIPVPAPGWKLVPVEPTREMLDHVIGTSGANYDIARVNYAALLGATPEPTPSATVPAIQEPTDPVRVACVTLDGTTLTVPVEQIGDVLHGEDDQHTYTLALKTMTRAEFDALGEFNGF